HSDHGVDDTDISTPVKGRLFYAGVQGSFSMLGMAGFGIRFALSDLGPLTLMITVELPTGIIFYPPFGLTLNDFVAGVEFFHTLPSITDPMALRGAAFQAPTNLTPDEWLSTVKS